MSFSRPPERSKPRAVLAAMRPRQWTKNAFVLAALILTGQLGQREPTVAAGLAFLVFCLVSSAVYIVNDVVDAASDREHPVKSRRPIASGELSRVEGLVLAAVLLAVALPASLQIRTEFVYVVAAYLALQVAYTFWLKHMVIVEVLAIAGGFVLRVLGGGAAIGEPISPFLYLSTMFLALFQGLGKRRHELTMLAEGARGHRQSLGDYNVELLDQLIGIAATATIVTYSLYPINTDPQQLGFSTNVLLLTIPFVIYAIFRYLYLIHVEGQGGTPEEILLKDKWLLLDVVGWAATILVILYVLRRPA